MSGAPRCAPRPRSSAAALMAGLAALLLLPLVVLPASVPQAGALPLLLAAAAIGVLTVVGVRTEQRLVLALPAPAHPSGVARAVTASTAYWCAIAAPCCPRRPRAPGLG